MSITVDHANAQASRGPSIAAGPMETTFRPAINAGAAVATLGLVYGLAQTLSPADAVTWTHPTPYLAIAASAILAFVAAALAAPQLKIQACNNSTTLALAIGVVMLLTTTLLGARLAQSNAQVDALRREYDQARADGDRLRKQVDAANQSVAALDKKLADARKDNTADAAKLAAMQAELDKAKADRDKLDSKLTAATERLNDLGGKIEAIEGKTPVAAATPGAGAPGGPPAGPPAVPGTPVASNTPNPTPAPGGDPDDDSNPADPIVTPIQPLPGGGGGNSGGGSNTSLGDGLAGIVGELIKALMKLVLPGLFDMGVEQKDIPAVSDAMGQMLTLGEKADPDDILAILKDTKDPKKVANAIKTHLRELLRSPVVRASFPAADLDRLAKSVDGVTLPPANDDATSTTQGPPG